MRKFGTVLAVMLKSSKLVKAMKATKALKPLAFVVSLTISVFTYALAFGVWFAIGLCAIIMVHELGHVYALRRQGLPTKLPIFIPLLGAVIFAPKLGNRSDEAKIGIAGPLVGFLTTLPFLAVLFFWDDPHELFTILVYVGFIINAFNMIPLSPLDGGRVTQAVGPWFKWIGVVMLLLLTFVLLSPGLLLIWILVMGDFAMNLWLRVISSWSLTVMMGLMYLTGVGVAVPGWIVALDIVMGAMWSGLYTMSAKEGRDYFTGGVDDRPQLNRHGKVKWLVAYAVLLIALSVGTALCIPFLPEEAK